MIYTMVDQIIRSGLWVNEKLAQILHRTWVKKFKREGYLISDIWEADLPEVG